MCKICRLLIYCTPLENVIAKNMKPLVEFCSVLQQRYSSKVHSIVSLTRRSFDYKSADWVQLYLHCTQNAIPLWNAAQTKFYVHTDSKKLEGKLTPCHIFRACCATPSAPHLPCMPRHTFRLCLATPSAPHLPCMRRYSFRATPSAQSLHAYKYGKWRIIRWKSRYRVRIETIRERNHRHQLIGVSFKFSLKRHHESDIQSCCYFVTFIIAVYGIIFVHSLVVFCVHWCRSNSAIQWLLNKRWRTKTIPSAGGRTSSPNLCSSNQSGSHQSS